MRALASERMFLFDPPRAAEGVDRAARRRRHRAHGWRGGRLFDEVATGDQRLHHRAAFAVEEGVERFGGLAAIGHEQDGALALAQAAVAGQQFAAALVGFDEHVGAKCPAVVVALSARPMTIVLRRAARQQAGSPGVKRVTSAHPAAIEGQRVRSRSARRLSAFSWASC
jgi:hypothetical protein